MDRRTFVQTTGAVGAVGLTGLAGCLGEDDNGDADDFPSESLTWMIPWGEGGGTDTYARQMAPLMEDPLDQSIEIDNREGAGSMLGSEWLVQQDPDGYTFGTVNPPGWSFTWRAQEVDAWEPEDLEPIAYSGVFGYTLIVNDDAAEDAGGIDDFESLRDAYADDEISGFGYQGAGSDSHLTTLLLREEYDLDYDSAVPYDGGGPTMEAVIGGEVAAGFATNTSAVAAEESGEATAIVNLMDIDLDHVFPDIDPITDYGDSLAWITEFYQVQVAPPDTPEEEREILMDAIQEATEHEETQEWEEETGNIVEFGDMDDAADQYVGSVEEIESQVDESIGGFDEFQQMVEEEEDEEE
ncbi:substrate-binding domain-containing protein [Natronococcus sp. A-GB1]|uniref:Bug family tripartite tricarboxylate transporter substrate binding protein n=1 Tax=Natronococcus sp. A-GB1 TaxID=3037648 RepID=UPI00241CCCC6|nr:substrate-binding domain-containing protein [Natronococcus sp. A-GB1]MDG5758282.1 substrate-binding domain-containing protein [Natronococcus sp. A-GB1]